MTEATSDTPEKTYNVLFICRANSARSIMAEAIMNNLGRGRFHAYSAGSAPTGQVHPMTLETLREHDVDASFARSKSWNEFSTADAPHMHFVFTVCDVSEGEESPVWPGHPLTGAWGVPDPKTAEGNDAERQLAFNRTYSMLARRIGVFMALPIASLDHLALKQEVDAIGQSA